MRRRDCKTDRKRERERGEERRERETESEWWLVFGGGFRADGES